MAHNESERKNRRITLINILLIILIACVIVDFGIYYFKVIRPALEQKRIVNEINKAIKDHGAKWKAASNPISRMPSDKRRMLNGVRIRLIPPDQNPKQPIQKNGPTLKPPNKPEENESPRPEHKDVRSPQKPAETSETNPQEAPPEQWNPEGSDWWPEAPAGKTCDGMVWNKPAQRAAADDIPEFDWRSRKDKNWLTSVKFQGEGCQSCVAFASIGALESLLKISTNNPDTEFDLSEANLFFCHGGSCQYGWDPEVSLEKLKSKGVPEEKCCPYAPVDMPCKNNCQQDESSLQKITSWGCVPPDTVAIKKAIREGPVMAVMTVYEDFYFYESGVYEHVYGNFEGKHAVVLIGYNDTDKYWIAKNSYGAEWGESGFFKIKYGDSDIEKRVMAMRVSNEAYSQQPQCPEGMAYIPPGTFMMGCSPGDNECTDDEKPAKQVQITKGFCMDKYEVSQKGYQQIMGIPSMGVLQKSCPTCSIYNLKWVEANNYCTKEGKRLPTEAEWEYAARGDTTTKYYWGNSLNEDYAWYEGNSRDSHQSGMKRPNKFGLFDMLGNVSEWVEDCYDNNWYLKMPHINPVFNPNNCDGVHVTRGGAMLGGGARPYFIALLRVSSRFPPWQGSGGFGDESGFRCVKDVENLKQDNEQPKEFSAKSVPCEKLPKELTNGFVCPSDNSFFGYPIDLDNDGNDEWLIMGKKDVKSAQYCEGFTGYKLIQGNKSDEHWTVIIQAQCGDGMPEIGPTRTDGFYDIYVKSDKSYVKYSWDGKFHYEASHNDSRSQLYNMDDSAPCGKSSTGSLSKIPTKYSRVVELLNCFKCGHTRSNDVIDYSTCGYSNVDNNILMPYFSRGMLFEKSYEGKVDEINKVLATEFRKALENIGEFRKASKNKSAFLKAQSRWTLMLYEVPDILTAISSYNGRKLKYKELTNGLEITWCPDTYYNKSNDCPCGSDTLTFVFEDNRLVLKNILDDISSCD